jgi:hypothetical protein
MKKQLEKAIPIPGRTETNSLIPIDLFFYFCGKLNDSVENGCSGATVQALRAHFHRFLAEEKL